MKSTKKIQSEGASTNFKRKLKNSLFILVQKILAPCWKVQMNRSAEVRGDRSVTFSVSVLIMHKDVGNVSRNFNFESQKKFAISSGYKLIESEAVYFDNISEGSRYINENLGLNIVHKYHTNFSGETIHFPYAPGALGIYATLVKALRDFQYSDSDYLLIFEDDLNVLEGFNDVLNYLLSRKNKVWDVLNLFSDPSTHKPLKSVIFQIFSPLIQNYSTSISACYVLNKSSAIDILVDLQENGLRTNLDWYLFNGRFLNVENQPTFKTLQVNPFFPKFCRLIPEYKISTILIED